MSDYLIIGRAVNDRGSGWEYRWRDSGGVLPNDDERHRLVTLMADHFYEVFGVNPTRTAVVALPSMGEKLYKHPKWMDALDSGDNSCGGHGLHVDDADAWPARGRRRSR